MLSQGILPHSRRHGLGHCQCSKVRASAGCSRRHHSRELAPRCCYMAEVTARSLQPAALAANCDRAALGVTVRVDSDVTVRYHSCDSCLVAAASSGQLAGNLPFVDSQLPAPDGCLGGLCPREVSTPFST